MANFVHYEIKDRVAVLTIDNPPVNALGAGRMGRHPRRRRARRTRTRTPTRLY